MEKLTEKLGTITRDDITDAVIVKIVSHLGRTVAKPTLHEIDALFQESRRSDVRRQLTQHFWCDLFATLAIAVAEFEQAMDEAPKRITEVILSSAHQKERQLITRFVVEKAVEKAWSPVKSLVASSLQTSEVLLSLRILAVLTCPAPEKHPAVLKHCLTPIGRGILEDATRERLRAVLPKELVGNP